MVLGLRTDPVNWDEWEAGARRLYEAEGLRWPEVVVHAADPAAMCRAWLAAVTGGRIVDVLAADGSLARHAAARLHIGRPPSAGEPADAGVEGAAHLTMEPEHPWNDLTPCDDPQSLRDLIADSVIAAITKTMAATVGQTVSRELHDVIESTIDMRDRSLARKEVLEPLRQQLWVALQSRVLMTSIDRVDPEIGLAASQLPQGLWWGHWGYGFVSALEDLCGLRFPVHLQRRRQAYQQCLLSAWWWWLDPRFALACERPKAIHLEEADPDNRGFSRLHSEHGPAIVWPNGWGMWFIHGVRVTRQVVEAPETLTVEQILNEKNATVRRVMIDRFGTTRLLLQGQASVIDTDVDQFGRPRVLSRLHLPDDEDLVMVQVTNTTLDADGTHRDYYLRVPPVTSSCADAVAWSFGMTAAEYAPAQET
jgi:hypothetical protein